MARRELICRLPWWPPGVGRIIHDYGWLTDEDRIEMLFSEKQGRLSIWIDSVYTISIEHIPHLRKAEEYAVESSGSTRGCIYMPASELVRKDNISAIAYLLATKYRFDAYLEKMRRLLNYYE